MFELEIEPPGDNGSSNVYCANKFDWFFASSIIGCGDDLSCNYNQSAIIIDNDICAFPGIRARQKTLVVFIMIFVNVLIKTQQ